MKKWIIPGLLVIFALILFISGNVLGGLLFILSAAFICPLGKTFLEKNNLCPSKLVRGLIVAFWLILGLALSPTTETSEDTAVAEAETESVAPETTLAETTTAVETETETTKALETTAPTVAPTTVAPTTVAPTTVAPSTDAPTTEVPATEVPSTEAETTIPVTTAPETTTPPETSAPETSPAITEVAPTEAAVVVVVPETTTVQEATEAAKQASNWDNYKGNATFNGTYYGTPKGECYHYSEECGGKNSKPITEEEAKRRKPCGTCVLK